MQHVRSTSAALWLPRHRRCRQGVAALSLFHSRERLFVRHAFVAGGVAVTCRIHQAVPPHPRHKPPSGPDRLHEFKRDGYRMMVRKNAAGVGLFTRRGFDWTDRFPAIRAAAVARALPDRWRAVCSGDDGIPEFKLLRQRLLASSVFLFAFDLQLKGKHLRREPIELQGRGAMPQDAKTIIERHAAAR
jgi:ATP-dependent DNA ligase